MREHEWHGPSDHKDPYESDSCQACALSFCKVCRGGEVELPTECLGRAMTTEEKVFINMGELDFDLGCWWLRGEIVWTDKPGKKVAYR